MVMDWNLQQPDNLGASLAAPQGDKVTTYGTVKESTLSFFDLEKYRWPCGRTGRYDALAYMRKDGRDEPAACDRKG